MNAELDVVTMRTQSPGELAIHDAEKELGEYTGYFLSRSCEPGARIGREFSMGENVTDTGCNIENAAGFCSKKGLKLCSMAFTVKVLEDNSQELSVLFDVPNRSLTLGRIVRGE